MFIFILLYFLSPYSSLSSHSFSSLLSVFSLHDRWVKLLSSYFSSSFLLTTVDSMCKYNFGYYLIQTLGQSNNGDDAPPACDPRFLVWLTDTGSVGGEVRGRGGGRTLQRGERSYTLVQWKFSEMHMKEHYYLQCIEKYDKIPSANEGRGYKTK